MLRSSWERLGAWLAGSKKSLLRRAVLTVVLVLPALAFIVYQTWSNWEQLRSYEWDLRPELWSVGFLGYTAALACLLTAWNYMMGRLGGKVGFRTNARLYCLSGLSKRLPGFIWYMISRAVLYRGEGVPASVSLTGSALEMALMAVTGLMVYFISLPFSGGVLQGWWLLGAVGVLLAGGIVLQPAVFNRVVGFFLRRLGSRARVQVVYRDILPPVPLYMLAWGVGGVVLHALTRSVYPLPLDKLPTMISIWAASGTLTLLLSSFLLGIGMREVTLSLLLPVMIPELQPVAVIVALMFGLNYVLSELFWTGVFALWRSPRDS